MNQKRHNFIEATETFENTSPQWRRKKNQEDFCDTFFLQESIFKNENSPDLGIIKGTQGCEHTVNSEVLLNRRLSAMYNFKTPTLFPQLHK